MNRSLLPILGAFLVLLVTSGCGRNDAGVQGARFQLRKGNLETAESYLEGETSAEAVALRKQIAERRVARAEIEREIARLETLPAEESIDGLKALLRGLEDPIAVDEVEVAISRAHDRVAEQIASRGHTPVHPYGYRLDQLEEPLIEGDPLRIRGRDGDDPGPERTRPGTDTLDRCRADIESALAERNWLRAWSELQMAIAVSGERVGEFRTLQDEILSLAQAEMVDLLDSAEALDGGGDLIAAHELLAEAVRRFPHLSGLAELRDELEAYRDRIDVLIAAARETEPETPRASAPGTGGAEEPGSFPETPVQSALALERGGDLQAAMDAWLEAGFAALPGPERDGCIARARSLERRILLREEIAAARAVDPEAFEELGILGADARQVVLPDGPGAWSALSLDLLKKAAAKTTLSAEAELGLVDERIARGDHAGRSGALAQLARLVERGAMSAEDAWEVVAQVRGESVPEKGYVFQAGKWASRADLEDAETAAAIAKLERSLERADAEEREALLASLEDFGPGAAPAVEQALGARWNRAVKALRKGANLSALERLAADREELDRRRETALELIFDEKEYFYPYRPPECPPDKARLYWPVQQRVDELVAAVREVWSGTRATKLSSGFRETVDDLAWTLAAAEERGLDLSGSEEIPEWVWGIPTELDAVGVREFAWDTRERDALRRDRAVLAFTRLLWQDADSFDEAQRPRDEEQRQVEITNEYRMMLGRRALAWNPRIQAAARGHSDYMAATGRFGHFEEGDPERRTPFDRMRLAGYESGVSENCHRGSGSPEGAHNGWVRSSGHHRNLLMPGHREMASALNSGYWTQNFGVATEFERDLQPWQD